MAADWKTVVRKIAPTIGTALGGPFAGIAVKFIADKFLQSHDAGEAEIADTILHASPEQLTKLRELDNEFKLEMRRLGVREIELETQDRESARELAKVNMLPHIILSAIYTLAYAGLLYAFAVGSISIAETTRAEFNIVLGVLTAAQAQIMNFWFGSSSGSKQKDTVLTQNGGTR